MPQRNGRQAKATKHCPFGPYVFVDQSLVRPTTKNIERTNEKNKHPTMRNNCQWSSIVVSHEPPETKSAHIGGKSEMKPKIVQKINNLASSAGLEIFFATQPANMRATAAPSVAYAELGHSLIIWMRVIIELMASTN